MPSSQAIKFEQTENQDLRICSTATTIKGSDTHRSLTGGDDVIGFGITTLLEVFDCKSVIVFLSFLGFSFFNKEASVTCLLEVRRCTSLRLYRCR